MQKLKKWYRGIFFALACLLLCSAAVVVTVPMTVLADEEEEENENFSLYNVSLIIGQYMDRQTKPDEDGDIKGIASMKSGNSYICTGNAGAFTGYADKSWLSGLLSSSSKKQSYSSLQKMPTGSSGTSSAIFYYAQYGYLLGQLGLDSVSADSAVSMSLVSGGAMWAVYMMSLLVPSLFSIAIKVLKTMNPFMWMGEAINATGLANFADKMDTLAAGSPLAGVVGMLNNLFTALNSISWQVVVPLMFLSLIASWLLFRNAQATNNKLRKFIIMVFFLVVGLPICGGCYTGALNAMDDAVSSGNSASARLIASTFVDFESWAKNGRLSPVDGGCFRVAGGGDDDAVGGPSAEAYQKVRATAYYINQKYAFGGTLSGAAPFAVTGNAATQAAQWNSTLANNTSRDDSAVDYARSLLERFMSGEKYNSGDYEGDVKAELRAQTGDEGKAVNKMFEWSSEVQHFFTVNQDGDDADAKMEAAKKRFFDMDAFGGNYNVFSNGTIAFNNSGLTNGTYVKGSGASGSSPLKVNEKGGLSSVSMYNYLNTDFGNTNMVAYSPKEASSGFVIKSHSSVSLVGRGWMSVLYWLNAFMLLGSFTVIGLFYGFAIIFANFKRSIKLLMAIPFAMTGMAASVAKVVTYTLMLIIEIVGTIFMYQLVTEILMGLSNVIEMPFAMAMNNDLSGVSGRSKILLSGCLLISSLVYFIFTLISLKLRKTVVKTMDEIAGDVVDKFIGAKSGIPGGNQPGILGKAADSVGRGVGMAAGNMMANKMMNRNPQAAGAGSSSKPSSSSSANGAGGAGPDGVGPDGTPLIASGTGSDGMDGMDGSGGDSISMAGQPMLGDGSGADTSSMCAGGDADGMSGGEDGGGSSGMGMAVSSATGAAFSENNTEQNDKALSERLGDSLAGPAVIQSPQELKSDVDAKTQAAVDEVTGKTSAVESDANDDMKSEIRKEAAIREVKAGAQVVVGGAEVIGAYATGDSGLANDAVKNVVNGGAGMHDAAVDAKNAEREVVDNQNAINETKSVTAGDSYAQNQSFAQNDGNDTKVNANMSSQSSTDVQKGGSMESKVNAGDMIHGGSSSVSNLDTQKQQSVSSNYSQSQASGGSSRVHASQQVSSADKSSNQTNVQSQRTAKSSGSSGAKASSGNGTNRSARSANAQAGQRQAKRQQQATQQSRQRQIERRQSQMQGQTQYQANRNRQAISYQQARKDSATQNNQAQTVMSSNYVQRGREHAQSAAMHKEQRQSRIVKNKVLAKTVPEKDTFDM